LLFIPDQLNVV